MSGEYWVARLKAGDAPLDAGHLVISVDAMKSRCGGERGIIRSSQACADCVNLSAVRWLLGRPPEAGDDS
jgi:hypothetical protein